MPGKKLDELIAKIFKENHRTFMTLKQVVFHMPMQAKRDFGVLNLTNAAEMQKILDPFLDKKKYVFHRRGTFIFIIDPKPHEDFILEILEKKARTPKDIARLVPFSKKETSQLISELVDKKILSLKLEEDLQTRVYIIKKEKQPVEEPVPETPKNSYAEYTVENFRNAFRSLDKGRIFVRICDLRKTLGWPRQIFDSALKQLRDAKLIQLHAGDVTLMTPEEVQDCFIDENNFRMGTVTWHGR